MRVLFMHAAPSPNPISTVHLELMRSFDRRRVQAHVAYADPAGATSAAPELSMREALEAIPGLALRPVRFAPPVNGLGTTRVAVGLASSAGPAARDALGLIRYIRRNRIDVIHCGHQPSEAAYGLWLARVTGARCVVHLHVNYGTWMSRVSRRAIPRADGIIGVSDWVGERVRGYGVRPERLFTVHNGIDPEYWDPAAADGSRIRREFEIAGDTPLLAIVGGLRPWKGQDQLLAALGRVAVTHRNFKLLVVGAEDMPVSRGTITDELRRIVADAGLDHHVVFTGSRPDVREILAAADIFAMPTYEDPCPLAFLEAMAMRTPIVAIRSGGVPEIVDNGRTALLSPAHDSGWLADNIIRLLDDPARRRAMGERGRRRILDSFTATAMADGVERVYRTLAGEPK